MILKLSCPDRPGLVARIAGFIAGNGGNILEMSQFTDTVANWFFVRISFAISDLDEGAEGAFQAAFAELATELKAEWHFRHPSHKTPTAILVTREAHCFHDLIARSSSGELPLDIRIVLSNHESLRETAENAGLRFHFIPIRKEHREADFAAYQQSIEESGSELLILARFMQILPVSFCAAYAKRAINIHHSFLPAFIGANPYRQAFERGVKIIGATAHYVTSELDAGPIIEQEVSRVEHFHTPDDLKRLGRDCECLALSRAVRFHTKDRILVRGNKTVVFRD